jgi:CubicO group peptidase (beta-lactamase class C family)
MHVSLPVQGECHPRFQAVRDEFERNFCDRGEVGASVCVIHEGVAVVDLWGGTAERRSGRPWERDTIGLVWSCTKGAAALCAHILVSRQQLDLDAPVAHYWPEFAQAGKQAITVRLLLSHQAGLPALRQPLRPNGLYDWDYMTEALAAEEPFWPPGTRQGYHGTTFGHLVGELVRRISGKDVGTFFREEVADPLGLDFFIGLPGLRPDPVPRGEIQWRFLSQALTEPESVQALIVKNTGRRPGDQDDRHAHAALLPGQGGITNARGLAKMYAPLALGGGQLVDEGTLSEMQAVSSASAVDAVLLVGMRFSLGFVKSSDNRRREPGARDSVILSESAFGHPGLGGSLGFADPAARLSFGYTMNKQGRGVLLNERGQSLVDAVYRSLGYRGDRHGRWV